MIHSEFFVIIVDISPELTEVHCYMLILTQLVSAIGVAREEIDDITINCTYI